MSDKQFQWDYPEHILLWYGAGGAGTSSLLNQLAVHVWKTFGKKTRIVGADGGGTKPFQVLMKKGIIEYWPIDQWEHDVWTVYDRATMGWWPESVDIPNSKLLPAWKEHYICPFCKARTKTIPACSVCKKPIPAGTFRKEPACAVRRIDHLCQRDQIVARCAEPMEQDHKRAITAAVSIDTAGQPDLEPAHGHIVHLPAI